MYQRVVVPLDGSDIAEIALVEAEEMASILDVPIHLVRVVNVADQALYVDYGKVSDSSDASTVLADEVETVRQYLDSVASRMLDQGYRVSHELRCGSVVSELISASKPGDLYVMGSHGRSGISRWFLGSVAEDVVRRSQVPVLLIRSTQSPGNSLVSSRAGVREVTALAVADPHIGRPG